MRSLSTTPSSAGNLVWQHRTAVTENSATPEPWHTDLPLETWHHLSSWSGLRVCGSARQRWTLCLNSTLVNVGTGNSFVFNLLFLSSNVFQKRKPPSKLLLGFFWPGLFYLMVKNPGRRGGAVLGDALRPQCSLPCRPPTLKQHVSDC